MPAQTDRTALMSPLEPRRLMSFTAVGRETVLPGVGSGAYDVAVAAGGASWVASVSVVRSGSLQRDVNVLTVQGYDALGRPLGGPMVVTRYAQPGAGVAIDANPAGQAVVAYVERRGDVEVLTTRQISPGGGGEAGENPPRRLFRRPAGRNDGDYQSAIGGVAISMTNAGGYFVAYRSADVNKLLVQYVGPDANATPNVITALDVTDGIGGDDEAIGASDIAARPDGSGAVFATTVTGAGDGIAYGTVSTTAKTGEDGRLIAGSDANSPAVAIAADNGFVITYNDNTLADNFGGAGTAAQRFDAAGASKGAPIRLESGLPTGDGPSESLGTSVAATNDGGFVVAFGSYVEDGNDIEPGPAFARRFAADGTPDESGLITLSQGNAYGSAAIDVDAYGNALVAYAKAGRTGLSGIDRSVGLRRITGGILVDHFEAYVVGTNGDDVIRVDAPVNNRVRVTVNHTTRLLPVAYVGAISVAGLGGNDRIDVNHAMPATISGGAGADTVFGSDAIDLIRGDDGEDRLYGNGGNDTLIGGRGSDFLRGGAGDDDLRGEANDVKIA